MVSTGRIAVEEVKTVRYRPLGRTGVSVSALSLGTVNFGPRANTDRGACTEIIHRALDAGINLVDTADIYSGGVAEEMWGAHSRVSARM